MLTVTASATEAIRRLVDNTPDLEDGALRIAAVGAEQPDALSLTLVEDAQPGDEVLDGGVCLDPVAAEALEDKILDATLAEDEVTFVVRDEDDDAGRLTPSPNGDGPH
jgi:hypothetical protein